jgi:hypothetical protein
MDEVSKWGGIGDPVTVGVLVAELIGEEVEDMVAGGWLFRLEVVVVLYCWSSSRSGEIIFD